VLARPKFAFPRDDIEALLAMLRARGELFRPTGTAASPDPEDTKFLRCAQAAQADFIVTGNKRGFSRRALRSDACGQRRRIARAHHIGDVTRMNRRASDSSKPNPRVGFQRHASGSDNQVALDQVERIVL
jgi:predicted nucleic acid-binding protein